MQPKDRPGTEPTAELSLVDWRRRIAELYAEVRREAAADPASAHETWRVGREQLFREHAQSPVPAQERSAFRALHFRYDPALRFEVVVMPASAEGRSPFGASPALPNSGSDELRFHRLGIVAIPFAVGERALSVFWLDEYSGGLFVPFRDATSGHQTYGAGRYLLDTAKGADLGPGRAPGSIVLDFNFAFQPSCAFDPRWACPLAPPENRLDLAVRAGERIA